VAPPNIGELVADDAIIGRFNEVQDAMKRLKSEIASARLDVADRRRRRPARAFPDLAHALDRDLLRREQYATRARQREALRRARGCGTTARRCAATRTRPTPIIPATGRLAVALIEGLIEREFDISAVAGLGDGQNEWPCLFVRPRWYLNGTGRRLLACRTDFLNTYNPPNPPLPKTLRAALGKALKELIESYPRTCASAWSHSGGLKPFRRRRRPHRSITRALMTKTSTSSLGSTRAG